MASWTSFAWGFFAGLLVGEVTLFFFLAVVRQDSPVETVESPLLAAGHETPAGRESFPIDTIARPTAPAAHRVPAVKREARVE